MSKFINKMLSTIGAAFMKQSTLQDNTVTIKNIDYYLNSIQFNGAVLVQSAEVDNSPFFWGFGGTSVSTEVNQIKPITQDTVFCLSSTSKQFTAAAILKLLELGTIKGLDDVIGKYIPATTNPIVPQEWRPWLNEVTIRQLLEHKSGLPANLYPEDDLYFIPGNHDGLTMYGHFFAEENRLIHLNPEQVGVEDYSNFGYELLAVIVENASGDSYPRFLQKHFFDPLELDHTFVGEHPYHTDITAQHANMVFADPLIVPFVSFNPVLKTDMNHLKSSCGNNMLAYGSDRIYSTPAELHKWNVALFNGEILNPESFNIMLGDRTNASNSSAYGLTKNIIGSLEYYGHGGSNMGFEIAQLYFPEKKLTIAVMSNVSPDYEFFTSEENLTKLSNLDSRENELETEFELSMGEAFVPHIASNIAKIIVGDNPLPITALVDNDEQAHYYQGLNRIPDANPLCITSKSPSVMICLAGAIAGFVDDKNKFTITSPLIQSPPELDQKPSAHISVDLDQKIN